MVGHLSAISAAGPPGPPGYRLIQRLGGSCCANQPEARRCKDCGQRRDRERWSLRRGVCGQPRGPPATGSFSRPGAASWRYATQPDEESLGKGAFPHPAQEPMWSDGLGAHSRRRLRLGSNPTALPIQRATPRPRPGLFHARDDGADLILARQFLAVKIQNIDILAVFPVDSHLAFGIDLPHALP